MRLGVVLVGAVSQKAATHIDTVVVFKQRVVEPGALQKQVLDGVRTLLLYFNGRGKIHDSAK
jgi:hypothetical protein